jgi:hypothetical protein
MPVKSIIEEQIYIWVLLKCYVEKTLMNSIYRESGLTINWLLTQIYIIFLLVSVIISLKISLAYNYQ